MVVGGSRKFIAALIVPNFEKLEAYAAKKGISFKDRRGLVARPEIYDFYMDEVDRMTPHLASYEKVKKIALLDQEFDIGRGEMTPTLKVRRKIVEDKYKDVINALYKENG